MSTIAPATALAHPPRAPLDRRGLGGLALGHVCADLCQGAIPALLPFLAHERGYSYGALGTLMLAAAIGSACIQPLFGILADRTTRSWMIPLGIALGGIGIGLVGLAPSYPLTVAAVACSGVGVALFHPEAARFAGIAAGARAGRGMSYFSLGGNVGFALGPILTTPLVLAFGLPGTVGVGVLCVVAALVVGREVGRLRVRQRARTGTSPHARVARQAVDAWGAFGRLGVVIALRSSIYFALQAFVPAYFVAELAASEATGNAALTAMLVAGALGTLAGGELVERIGARAVLAGSMVLLTPLLLALPLLGATSAMIALALIGCCTIASFSVTVVLGQRYLPSRPGFASGVTLGLAIGVGGLAAAALGAVADAFGLVAVLWIVAALPLPAALLSWSLPRRSPRMGEGDHTPARPHAQH